MSSALDELVNAKNWSKSSISWRGEGYPADVTENAAAELARLRDNYKATSELLAIREEQIEEMINEKAHLLAALDKAYKLRIDLIDECIKTQRRAEKQRPP